jgi:hypothetical protein
VKTVNQSNQVRRGGAVVAATFAACLLASCSGSRGGPAVRGTVTAKGVPVAGALVVFHPRGETGGAVVRPTAVTGEDGTFVLRTAGAEGAPAGEYDVTIVWEKPIPPAARKSPGIDRQDALNGKYARAAESGLKATIQPGDNELPPFDLK